MLEISPGIRGKDGQAAAVAAAAQRFLQWITVAYAAVFGLSGLANGYYELKFWGPLGVLAAVLLVAVLTAWPLELGRIGTVATCALAFVFLWTVLSATWSDALHSAWLEANRFGLYLVIFLGAVTAI